MEMVHPEGVGLVLPTFELILGCQGTTTTIEGPIVRVVRGRGRVLACQVTIDWAMVGHLAMEAHGDGPS